MHNFDLKIVVLQIGVVVSVFFIFNLMFKLFIYRFLSKVDSEVVRISCTPVVPARASLNRAIGSNAENNYYVVKLVYRFSIDNRKLTKNYRLIVGSNERVNLPQVGDSIAVHTTKLLPVLSEPRLNVSVLKRRDIGILFFVTLLMSIMSIGLYFYYRILVS